MRNSSFVATFLLLAVIGSAVVACGGDSSDGDESVVADIYPTATVPAELSEPIIVSGTPQPATGNSTTYVVQEGDTLESISAEVGVPVEELMTANGITDPTALFVGQELTIPGEDAAEPTAEPQEGPPPEPTEVPPEEPPAEPTEASGEQTYTVQEGDFPASIAEQFGISVEALMAANGITDPAGLHVGDVLVIPAPE